MIDQLDLAEENLPRLHSRCLHSSRCFFGWFSSYNVVLSAQESVQHLENATACRF